MPNKMVRLLVSNAPDKSASLAWDWIFKWASDRRITASTDGRMRALTAHSSMTRIRFDQLSKQYLEEFLAPLGTVQRNLEVPGEPKFVDVWFTPAPQPTAAISLGLMSRMATTPCLLEPFRNAPNRQDMRTCLLKLLWIQEDLRRKAEQAAHPIPETDLPKLWILAATVTRPLLAEFGGQVQSDWGAGVYVLPAAHRTVIVAIDQLPSSEETLWVRILGRGRVQQEAIAELLTLPTDDPRRSRALQLLVAWKITIEVNGTVEQEEGGLMTALSQAYLEWEQQTLEQGIEQGIERGIERGERALILRLLTRRVGEVPEFTRSRIESLSLPELERLGEALLDFSALADLESWLHDNQ